VFQTKKIPDHLINFKLLQQGPKLLQQGPKPWSQLNFIRHLRC
jgi:hypothetical protein